MSWLGAAVITAAIREIVPPRLHMYKMKVFLYITALLCLTACDEPTSWPDQGKSCLDCELEYTQWFKDIGGGEEWEWLFKENTFLSGRRGSLLPIEGTWEVSDGFLVVYDNVCINSKGLSIEGKYMFRITQDNLSLMTFTDGCRARQTVLSGVWDKSL